MEKIITGIEFAILVAIIIGIIILLNVMEARRRINAANSQPQDDYQAKEDEAQHRRMVHEADNKPCADLEPFCGGSDAHSSEQERRAQAEADRQARSRQAIRRAQEAARNSTVRHFAEDLSKRDDELMTMHRQIQRQVLAEQRVALDQMMGKKP